MNYPLRNIPTVFVMLGATGDLMARKILPALYDLQQKGNLPKLLKIIAYSRRDWTDEDYQAFVLKSLVQRRGVEKDAAETQAFLRLFSYQQGDFTHIEGYKTLAQRLGYIDDEWKVCSNKLFYLAVPPQYYQDIFNNLHTSGLTIPCSPEEGWTRVLVEKPFGKDFETAQQLDQLLGKLFKEEQIYRIDHYLAKEMIQNILSFRFANNLFEEIWNNKFVEKIEVRLMESLGIEGRADFYDGVGALRDIGQNHVLQMLALVTMDQPLTLDAEHVRPKRADILKQLHKFSFSDVARQTFRAQYDGYKDLEGVQKDSQTETYFRVIASLDNARWRGTPIILEGGKKLPRKKEIVVTFKHPTPCFCPPNTSEHFRNRVIFSLEPKEGITIEFWAKKPGAEYEMVKQKFDFSYKAVRKNTQSVEEYERLLQDSIAGNQLLFVSTQEVAAMWQFIDPIVDGWQKNAVPLYTYKPGKKDILMQAKAIEDHEITSNGLKKEIGIIGLGKMGGNIARRLVEYNWRVVGYNRTRTSTDQLVAEGGVGAYSLQELVQKLSKPRIIFVSLPNAILDDLLFDKKDGLVQYLEKGDIVIDGANAYFKDSIARAEKLAEYGISYVDVGVSGGPGGARYGASLMVGGSHKLFDELYPLYKDMAVAEGVQHFEGIGAGHFVKMVHNGIEYGMMQAIAEGFTVLKESKYKLDLKRVADIYNHGSVIESKLIEWLYEAFDMYGEDLNGISGSVAHTGEGAWTIKTAEEMKLKTKIIEESLQFRVDSEKSPSFTGKIVSALRNRFGGHEVKEKK